MGNSPRIHAWRRAALAAAALAIAFAVPSQAGAEIVPGEVIVRYAAGTSKSERTEARRDAGTAALEGLGLARLQLVRVTDGDSVRATVRELEKDPAVRYAEPNLIRRPAMIPNDNLFALQWGLHNTGQSVSGTSGTADADIDAPEAWDIETGDPNTIVAVMDTGADPTHDDLQDQLWTNATEAGGTAGVDDDGNGRVDDVNGFDFFDDDPDPADLDGHGTHVSGIALAEGDNGLGANTAVTGVSQEAALMSLRICGSYDDGCPLSDEVAAIDYAGDNGARVVNGSIAGIGTPTLSEQDALAAHPDTLYVFAAGNEELDVDSTPVAPCTADEFGAYPHNNVLCVAASTQDDELAGFSNFGEETVDLAAPGTNVLSTSSAKSIYAEDFEVDDFATAWTNSGSQNWVRSNEAPLTSFGVTDSAGGNYAASSTYLVTSEAATLPAGYSGCTLSYFRSVALGSGDSFEIEVLLDGVEKASSGSFTSADNSSRNGEFPLDHDFDAGGLVQVRLRLHTNGTAQANGIHMDNFKLFCHGSPGDNLYEVFDGTSMASPQVAGAAALLFSDNPSATASEVKDALLDTVDVKPDLANTVTGGRLNVHRALTGDSDPPAGGGGGPGGGPSSGGTPAATDEPPNTSFKRKPRKVVRTDDPRAEVVFRFASSEAGSTFRCRLDGRPYRNCARRIERRVGDGRHRLRVFAVDAAGNADPTPAVYRFRVVRVGD